MKTNIYIDNDGVINIIRKKYNHEVTGWDNHNEGYAYSEGRRFRILWAVELIEELNRLDKLDDVEFIVLSTWMGEFISQIMPLVGLDNPNWRVLTNLPKFDSSGNPIGDWEISRSYEWWKLQAIKADIELHAPDQVVWIDDDLISEPVAVSWALSQKNIHMIAPEMHVGITRTDIETIEGIITNGTYVIPVEATTTED